MAVRLRSSGTSTITLPPPERQENLAPEAINKKLHCDSPSSRDERVVNNGNTLQAGDQAQRFAYLLDSSTAMTYETDRSWSFPTKFFQVAARELSVLLILIETLILLGGYLMILGAHHSIRYCLGKLRRKNADDDNVTYNLNHVRNYYDVRPVPRRLPRGRMAGG